MLASGSRPQANAPAVYRPNPNTAASPQRFSTPVVRHEGAAQNKTFTVVPHPANANLRPAVIPQAAGLGTAAGRHVFQNPQPQNSQPGIVQTKKSGKRKQKLLRRSAKKRLEQSLRDRAQTPLAQHLTWDGTDDFAWQVSVQSTQPLIPVGYQPMKQQAHSSLSSMNAEAQTLFSANPNRVRVRYDEELPSSINKNRRVGQLTQTFVHELAAHGQHAGTAHEDEPDEQHDEMHDPATRTPYAQATQRAVRALYNDYQRKAFINAWNTDMLFQISGSDTIDRQEKRRRREWVKKMRLKLLKDETI